MKEWSKAIKACNEFAEEVGLTEKDVEQAINEVRNNKRYTLDKTQVIEDEQVTVDKDKTLKELMDNLHSKSDKELIEEYEKMGCKVKYTPGTVGEVIFKD